MGDGMSAGASAGAVLSTQVFGVPGPDVNAWGITKEEHGNGTKKMVRQSCVDPSSGAYVREWPLSDLTIETVLSRWGGGRYRVCWFKVDPSAEDPAQRHVPKGSGPYFELEPPPVNRAVAQPAAQPSGFEQAIQFMRLADDRTAQQLQSIATLAQVIAGRSSGGLDAAALQAIMSNQTLQTERLIQAMSERHEAAMRDLRTELASVRRELEAFEEEDDRPVLQAVPVAPSKPKFRPGQPVGDQLKTMVMSWVFENPGEAFALIAKGADLVKHVMSVQQQQQRAPAPHPEPSRIAARPVARPAPEPPSAPPVAPIEPEPEPAPAPPDVPGVNGRPSIVVVAQEDPQPSA